MDMADAVNIMLYASQRRNGGEGFAVWNIFHADDANRIRAFLREKNSDLHPTFDPIHSQHYFLDSHLRKELYETKGVISWRVEQRPGEAVFIPAGCAHQVRNQCKFPLRLTDSSRPASGLEFGRLHQSRRRLC